ncbi:Sec-independent protein translocase TatB [Orbus hercynius]|uniref:Sec-independent protein translocase protein TatB n=1 Tax=Orbus hercynius TaxID=593135 RepID=A0A495RD43_9GAMM|nr:Sec-independent protein translocase protein TatB [Orbus hercynius]RKS85144.1 Sec-independent protein translocase TatB [Orbus hercynius]
MFDISFGELLLVLIIALLVLGPARLPEAIKTVAGWIKALRRLSATVQLELNKELRLQELQDSLKQAEKSGLDNITPEIKASIDDLKRVAESIQKDFYDTSDEIASTTQQAINGQAAKDPVTKNVGTSSVSDIGKDQHVG